MITGKMVPPSHFLRLMSVMASSVMTFETNVTQEVSGFNQTKRRWARAFLSATAFLLIFDKPVVSLITSSCAVYTMHGGETINAYDIFGIVNYFT